MGLFHKQSWNKSLCRLLSAVCFAATSYCALACTVCAEGPEGDGVNGTKAAIFNSDFGENLLLTIAPFLVIGPIIAAIHYAFPDCPSPDERDESRHPDNPEPRRT